MTNTPDSPDSNLKQMQWELINSILRKDSMDEIRILLASGAKVNEPHILGSSFSFNCFCYVCS